MILYEDMKAIEHVLLHPICVLSHLMCACKHCNIKLSLYYWTHWSCWWICHLKKRRIREIFDMTRPRHQGRLKKQIWVKKLSVGALHGWHAEKRLLPWLEANIWGFIAVLFLRNKTHNRTIRCASFATFLCSQRSGQERTAISSLHVWTKVS